MKRYLENATMVLFSLLAFTACEVEEGTEPGNDSNPIVTVYSYEPGDPYNPDNDVLVRVVANNNATDTYYLAEKTTDKEARGMSAEAYADYVVSNGSKLEFTADEQSGGKSADVILTDLFGEYTITAVAVKGNKKTSNSVVFNGLDWEDVVSGTYILSTVMQKAAPVEELSTTLQVCTTDATLYRFKDLYGVGSHLKINLLTDYTDTDADGTYTFFRVNPQKTPYTYGSYGNVWVRDIGYWQGSDAWVTDNGYESGMYDDYFCFVYVQAYVSAGSLGYDYDYFIPNN